MFFSHHFRTFSKNWSVFSKLFRSSWQNCILPHHRIILRTYLCFDKVFVCFFNDLWKLNGERTVFFRRKTIGSFVDPAYHVSKGLLCREFFPKKFSFFHHWALSDFSLSVLRKFVGPVVSTVSCLSNRPVCGEKNFWTLIAKWSVFVLLFEFFFGQVDDNAFYGSKGSIWGFKAVLTNFCLFYLSFADVEPKNQGFFSENNRQGCQNCSPRVQGDILQGIFFRKKFFFFIWSLGIDRLLPVLSTKICRSRCQYCFLFVN